MNTRLTAIIVTLCCSAFLAAETTFMVISDPHVMHRSLFDEGASFSGDPKLVEHSQELFDSAVARVLSEHPDILLIPGDLTKDGELTNHHYVSAALQAITEAGTKVYVIPGNHDINNPSAYSYLGGARQAVRNLPADSFPIIYAASGYNEAVMRMQGGLSYMAYPAEGLALICLDSNQPNGASRQSSGGLTEDILTWAEQAAAQAKADGRAVIGMMHHNIVEHFDGHARFASNYIANSSSAFPALAEVQQRLIAAGFKVMFTGHFHIHSIQHVISEQGELYDIATGACCSFNSPVRSLTWDDSVLTVMSDTIGLYNELKQQRNRNTTLGAIRVAADKGFPILQDSLSIFPQAAINMMNMPQTKAEMIAGMDSFLLEPFTAALNSLSLGDENTLHAMTDTMFWLNVKIDCMLAFNNYVDYVLGNYKNATILTPGYLRVTTAVNAARSLVEKYLDSVLQNYVGNKSNSIADWSLAIPLSAPQPTVGIEQTRQHNKAAKGIYSLDGKQISDTETALPQCGIYIINGEKKTVVRY